MVKNKTKEESKTDVKIIKIEETDGSILQEDILPPEPVFLDEKKSLYFHDIWEEKDSAEVPPATPKSIFEFESAFSSLPNEFPDLNDLEIPYIREKGVKYCIETLAEYFGCTDYKTNLFQFWFLDTITDCLWKAQDEFRFPIHTQKIVLGWILYIFNMIRDPNTNFSRKKLFKIFKETILVAGELVDEGAENIPLPQELFELLPDEDEFTSSSSSSSSTSSISILSSEADAVSYINIKVDEESVVGILPKEPCNCDIFDLSSINTLTETIPSTTADTIENEPNIVQYIDNEDIGEMETEFIESDLEDIDFYQPDPNIPSRFLPLPEEEELNILELKRDSLESLECVKKDTKIENIASQSETHQNTDKYNNIDYDIAQLSEEYEILSNSELLTESTMTCPSTLFIPDDPNDRPKTWYTESTKSRQSETNKSSGLKESKLEIKDAKSKAKQSKSKDLAVTIQSISKTGTSEKTQEEIEKEEKLEKSKSKKILKSLTEYQLWEQRIRDMADPMVGWVPEKENGTEDLEKEDDVVSNESEWFDVIEKNRQAIKDSHDETFFNFGVLWAIIDFIFNYFYESFQFTVIKLAFQAYPNIISQKVNDQWKVPKLIKDELKKPVKKKEKKEKKPKKEKPKKGKKDKSSKKGSKKSDKSKKSKKDKKGKKGKKEKPKKLTKEEKAELERQRREQERLEEELRKIEENKRFMFPLGEAATDDLFKGIFENWVKINTEKGKKGKKGKGDKKGKGKKKK